ncbi:GntR family transcriptional regulator [Brevibacillus sp. B_LB10_24]|uniref:GntR family transcriptional regulator n=1 Tax=Brevibacillus sp. B_LB10_24 TaxID=3380645 RepID=UPI0038BB54B2
MKLDKNSPIPLYHQLKTIIEEKIALEEWLPGFQLPTENELAEALEVSRITVKRAITDLVHAGLLYRQQGKGTFVTRKGREEDLYQSVSLANDDASYPHKTVSFSIEPAGESIAKALGIAKSDLVAKINRIKLVDEEPTVIEYSYLPCDVCPDFTPQLIENDLIYNVLKKRYQVVLDRAKIYLASSVANEYEASLLKIRKGTSVIVMERTTYTSQNRIVEFSKFIERSDRARYYLEVKL